MNCGNPGHVSATTAGVYYQQQTIDLNSRAKINTVEFTFHVYFIF